MEEKTLKLEKDKCNICALKMIFDEDHTHGDLFKVENFFSILRELQNENIVENGFARRAFASFAGKGDKSEMCAVNSKYFLQANKNKKCPHFILNMNLKVSDAMSLNLAKSTDRLTRKLYILTIVIIAFTIISIAISLVDTCLP